MNSSSRGELQVCFQDLPLIDVYLGDVFFYVRFMFVLIDVILPKKTTVLRQQHVANWRHTMLLKTLCFALKVQCVKFGLFYD